MRQNLLIAVAIFSVSSVFAQNKDKGTFQVYDKGESYYYSTILKDINSVEATKHQSKAYKRFKADANGKDYPAKADLYTSQWHNPSISQGSTGTCWDFSTTSFYESEVKRVQNKEVKISEAFTFYNEYILKAEGFVDSRGTTIFGEGSEGNAVARVYKRFGAMPWSAYNGLNGQKFHSHNKMYAEMSNYLESIKENNAWDKNLVIATIKSYFQ